MNRPKHKAFIPKSATASVLPLPAPRKMDRRGGVRSGALHTAVGVDPRRLPDIGCLPKPRYTGRSVPGVPLSLHSIEGVMYVIYEENGTVKMARYFDENTPQILDIGTDDPTKPRSMVRFNFYDPPENPLQSYVHYTQAVVLPDALYCKANDETATLITMFHSYTSDMPVLDQGCVHMSRLFGIRGDHLYASSPNDISRWRYRNEAGFVNASHSWVTTSQSNARTAGDFTGLTVYAGQVLAFKRGVVLAVYNTYTPFRISELLTVGAVDGRSIAQVNGDLLFAGEGQVYRYNGDSLRAIGSPLNITDFEGSIGASAGGLYYLYVPSAGEVFVYSTETNAWAVCAPFTDTPIRAMMSDEIHCWFLAGDGKIYTTEGATFGEMQATYAPLMPTTDTPFRPGRMRLTLTAAPGTTLSVHYRDSRGRLRPLLSYTGQGRTERLISRVWGDADFGGEILYSATGDLSIHAAEMVVKTQQTDI